MFAVLLLTPLLALAGATDLPRETWIDPVVTGTALLARDAWPEALQHLQGAVDVAPQRLDLVTLLGDAAWRGGQLERALQLYVLAARQAAHPRALAGIARDHWVHGRNELAHQVSQQAVRLAPGNADCWLVHGVALARLARRAEAEEALRRAAALPGGARSLQLRRTRELEIGLRPGDLRASGDPPSSGPVPLRMVDGFPVVDVRVRDQQGGMQSVPMVLDTGGSYAVGLETDLLPELQLEVQGRRAVAGVRGVFREAQFGQLPELQLGAWTLRELPALVYRFGADYPDRPRPPYVGNLGPLAARESALVLDFADSTVEVTRELPSPPPDALVTPFRLFADGKILIALEVNDERAPLLALVDSGAVRSMVSERLAARLSEAERPRAFPTRRLRLLLDGEVYGFAAIRVRGEVDRGVSPAVGTEVSLVLGCDFLRRFRRVVVDYRDHRITWLPEAPR